MFYNFLQLTIYKNVFFFFFYLPGDGEFASIEFPSSESSDSSDVLLASGSKGRGGGKQNAGGVGNRV